MGLNICHFCTIGGGSRFGVEFFLRCSNHTNYTTTLIAYVVVILSYLC